MNYKEQKSYNHINDAKRKIKRAKDDHESSIAYMNNLVKFIEDNIKVDGVKNLRNEVKQYTNQMTKNNTNLDILISRLDKHQEKIKEISKLREEAEKFGN